MKTILVSAIALSTVFGMAGSTVLAKEAPLANPPAQVQAPNQMTWLGVNVGPVSASLAAQLSAVLPGNQGVLVQSVVPNSPAEKAGIKAYDVLLTFADQKLYAPSQLSKLVRSSHPSESVALQVIQQGKVNTITAQLGGKKGPDYSHSMMPFYHDRMPPWVQQQMQQFEQMQQQMTKGQSFEQFERLQINRLKDGRYHAEIEFLGKDDTTKKFTFEGEKEEIQQQIEKNTDMPSDKKQALLQSLQMETQPQTNWNQFPRMPMPQFWPEQRGHHPFWY